MKFWKFVFKVRKTLLVLRATSFQYVRDYIVLICYQPPVGGFPNREINPPVGGFPASAVPPVTISAAITISAITSFLFNFFTSFQVETFIDQLT